MTAYTGKTDGTLGPIEHECLDDAEDWIAERELIDPTGVRDGDYYIDVLTEDGERIVSHPIDAD